MRVIVLAPIVLAVSEASPCWVVFWQNPHPLQDHGSCSCRQLYFLGRLLGARLRGCMPTHASRKGSEKVLERFLGKGSQKGS